MAPDFLAGVRAVVFDFDGTLADTTIDFAEMRRRTVAHVRSWGLWEDGLEDGRYVLEMIEHAAAKLVERPANREEYLAQAAQILEDVEMLTCPRAAPFPRTGEALDALSRRGYKTGIITRNCRRGVRSVMDRHHLHHDILLTRDDVELVKPDKAHLLEALVGLGVAPSETLMVGDHPSDIECGRAAGTFTCGVLTTATPPEQLEEAGAHLIVEDVATLADMLCTLGR